ncbi:ABC transporter permease [Solwaraspora sp. WMMD1047]|uniref:ABC transporter permease n=1 Tax=Solwaraspora sp. WMMD1047 TaxID=3016102 RepID=UPI00241677E6|nr:ABC transporter permease [Solwaraspora sp. WMMD1047]MDG4830398.1 ABC transporter permease [Solwaraspora sp. WMMD1047]
MMTVTVADQVAEPVATPRRRRAGSTFFALLRRPSFVVAFGFLVFLIVVAAAAPLIAPRDPDAQVLADRLQGPSGQYLLGTDNLGRDVLSRLIFAARLALLAPLIAVGVAILVGVPAGLWAGLRGGWVDAVTGRLSDTLLSLPGLAFALAVVAVLGPGLVNAMVAMGIVFAPSLFRVVRGSTLAVAEESFIESARAIGASVHRIIWIHVLPNIAAPFLVQVTILMGVALLAEASLSFLGLGVQAPDSSWGSMLEVAYQNQYAAPLGVLPAGAALVLTVLSFNTIGDCIRDAVARRRDT